MPDKEIKKSVYGVLVWIMAALAFDAGIWYFLGFHKSLEFIGGYLIEWSLSIDNLFVFLAIFMGFGVTKKAQHKALTFGIAGAVILRFLFIFFGLQLINRFVWLLYIVGFFLVINGFLMFVKREKDVDPANMKIMNLLKKFVPMTSEFTGEKLFVRENKKIYATPLFAVIVLIEFSDLIFATDSIPAVFSISTNLFIVYTSNIFAILGLRQLYFVLESLQERFAFLKYGVAVILIFTGIKIGIGVFNMHIETPVSIGIIFLVIISSVIISLAVSARSLDKKQHLS
jgi:tellurite resistance protein TerC